MNYTFKITNVKAITTSTEENRVCFISWLIEFEKQGFISIGAGETVLDISTTIENFIPIEDITEEKLISWLVSKEGGDAFIAMLTQIHEPNIDLQILKSNSVNIDLPFIQKQEQSVLAYDIQEVN